MRKNDPKFEILRIKPEQVVNFGIEITGMKGHLFSFRGEQFQLRVNPEEDGEDKGDN